MTTEIRGSDITTWLRDSMSACDREDGPAGMIRDFTRRYGMAPDCTCSSPPVDLRHEPTCALKMWAKKALRG